MANKFAAKGSTVMYVSIVTMIVAFVVWSMISPIAPQLQRQFGLTEFQKSILVATPVLLGIAGTSFAVGIGHVSAWFPPMKQGLVLGITALMGAFRQNTGSFTGGFLLLTIVAAIAFVLILFTGVRRGLKPSVGKGHVAAM